MEKNNSNASNVQMVSPNIEEILVYSIITLLYNDKMLSPDEYDTIRKKLMTSTDRH